jgi:hypothetical protein
MAPCILYQGKSLVSISAQEPRIVTDGWLVHYNFFRPHSALGGKTPAEAADAEAPFKSWADVVKIGGKK